MASGDYLAIFTALHNEFPTTSPATHDWRNQHPVLDFDDTTDENAVFAGVLPPNYSGGGITVELHWAATSATTGTCRWQAAFERIGTAQDIDSNSFASANSAGTATSATSGILSKTAITFTNGAQIDSLAVGEGYRLQVNRDANGTSGTDDMTGDAELRFVVVKET